MGASPANQVIASYKARNMWHDTENCLACNAWYWADEERAISDHLWLITKKPTPPTTVGEEGQG